MRKTIDLTTADENQIHMFLGIVGLGIAIKIIAKNMDMDIEKLSKKDILMIKKVIKQALAQYRRFMIHENKTT